MMDQETEGYIDGYPGYTDDQPLDFRRYLKAFWKRKLFVIIPFFLFAAGSVAYSHFFRAESVYRASATIVYRKQGSFTRPLESYFVEEGISRQLDLARVQIYSSEFLNRVITNMGLDQNEMVKSESGREVSDEVIRNRFVNYLRGLITVNTESRGMVFHIVAHGPTPDEAMNLANSVANTFIEENRRLQIQRIRSSSDFTVEQLAAYKEKLQEAERKLQEYQESVAKRKSSQDETARFQKLDRAKSLLLTANVDLSEAETRIDRMQSGGTSWGEKNAKDNLSRDSQLKSLVSRFLGSESDLVDLLLVKNWKDLNVVSLNEDIYRTKEKMSSRMRDVLSEKNSELSPDIRENIIELKLTEIEVTAIRSRKRKLQNYIDRFEKEAGSGYESELILSRLMEEVVSSRKVYNLFLEQSAAAQISEALEITKLGSEFEILESARRPFSPVNPRKNKAVLLGTFLGLFLGFGLALVLEFMDSSLKTVEEAEKYLQLPVIGTVPVMPYYSGKKKKNMLRIAILATLILMFLAALSLVIIWKMNLWKKILAILPI